MPPANVHFLSYLLQHPRRLFRQSRMDVFAGICHIFAQLLREQRVELFIYGGQKKLNVS